MADPIYALKFVHDAICTELRRFDDVASAANDSSAIAALADDLAFFTELMQLHHKGEEVGVFSLLDESSPGYSATYLFDHRAEIEHLRSLCAQTESARSGKEIDLKAFRRELSQLVAAGLVHIEKENTLILPELAERFSAPEQGEIVGNVVGAIPKDQMPPLVPWIVKRLDADGAEAYVRGLMAAMPAPAFEAAKGWISSGVPAARWNELQERIAELA